MSSDDRNKRTSSSSFAAGGHKRRKLAFPFCTPNESIAQFNTPTNAANNLTYPKRESEDKDSSPRRMKRRKLQFTF